jgi:hypothetical protein
MLVAAQQECCWRMPSSGTLRRVALVRTDVSEEPSASITQSHLVFLLSVRQLLVKANLVPSPQILVILVKNAIGSYETSVPTRATRRNIQEDDILHSHRRENFKSYRECSCLFSDHWLTCYMSRHLVRNLI